MACQCWSGCCSCTTSRGTECGARHGVWRAWLPGMLDVPHHHWQEAQHDRSVVHRAGVRSISTAELRRLPLTLAALRRCGAARRATPRARALAPQSCSACCSRWQRTATGQGSGCGRCPLPLRRRRRPASARSAAARTESDASACTRRGGEQAHLGCARAAGMQAPGSPGGGGGWETAVQAPAMLRACVLGSVWPVCAYLGRGLGACCHCPTGTGLVFQGASCIGAFRRLHMMTEKSPALPEGSACRRS